MTHSFYEIFPVGRRRSKNHTGIGYIQPEAKEMLLYTLSVGGLGGSIQHTLSAGGGDKSVETVMR